MIIVHQENDNQKEADTQLKRKAGNVGLEPYNIRKTSYKSTIISDL